MLVRLVSSKGIDLIKSFEGYSSTSYICLAGYTTIGFGHVIKSNENFTAVLSEDDAEALLKADLIVAESAVCRLIKVPLSDNQYAALVSFTFNLGGGALQRSTLRSRLNREEYGSVPSELQKWFFCGGIKSKGLIRRRAAEAALWVL